MQLQFLGSFWPLYLLISSLVPLHVGYVQHSPDLCTFMITDCRGEERYLLDEDDYDLLEANVTGFHRPPKVVQTVLANDDSGLQMQTYDYCCSLLVTHLHALPLLHAIAPKSERP